MQWWFWSVGAVILLIGALGITRTIHLGRLPINLLDVAVIPLWACLHMAMGMRFGVSWWAWFLMGWFIIGIGLSWRLTQKHWPFWVFWHKYWSWSGLFAAALVIIVTIIGFIYH